MSAWVPPLQERYPLVQDAGSGEGQGREHMGTSVLYPQLCYELKLLENSSPLRKKNNDNVRGYGLGERGNVQRW